MAKETTELAEYAATCRYEDFPSDVVERAKQCITDTVAAAIYGYDLPWSRMVVAFAEKNGAGGQSRILGRGAGRVHAPAAALANGALAHAFEMDNLTWPSTGVHPGATLLPSGLALAQERGHGGRELITAIVAGAEVMIRIGRATQHRNEGRGFHAPGTTGPFGAAVACARLLCLDGQRMRNALGIAGSLACGLLEFARAGNGAMVKRLHLGRAAESGVLAASLASDGFTGPASVLEGEFGFLRVFCGTDFDAGELIRGLGTSYATRSIMLKRFPCHITAQTSVQAILDLRAAHGYAAADVAAIHIAGNDKMARVNNIPSPPDIMLAQYSVPFCVALAHVRDARDPRSFDESALQDAQIRSLAQHVTITIAKDPPTPLAADVTVTLRDGRVLKRSIADFKGTPEQPLDGTELREKFLLLTRHCGAGDMGGLFDRLQNLEHETDLGWIAVGGP
ncbi:MAG TPA: MmgE/PrpD family protein [Xanthobacteraceae bacterium]|jgi:2-methylcitrate dehydratase PrpD|nr:MmgE/PrpD family protein [Xanthobacteraceae bacterium]